MQLIHSFNKHRAQNEHQKGDTLIEVLFAFAVLSLVVVGALSIMNRGTDTAEQSFETTLVRQQVDGQANVLRYLHDSYVARYTPGATAASLGVNTPAGQWATMSNALSATTASSITDLTACPATAPSGSFVLNPTNAKFVPVNTGMSKATTFAQIAYKADGTFDSAQGIWIEGIRAPASTDVNQQNTRYIDFHIIACWDSPGGGSPSTIGTIVRLYEPRG